MICSFKSPQCFGLDFFTSLPVTPFMLSFHSQLGTEIQPYGLFSSLSTFFLPFKNLLKRSLSWKTAITTNTVFFLRQFWIMPLSLTTWSFWKWLSSKFFQTPGFHKCSLLSASLSRSWSQHQYCAFPVTKTSKDVQILHDAKALRRRVSCHWSDHGKFSSASARSPSEPQTLLADSHSPQDNKHALQVLENHIFSLGVCSSTQLSRLQF